MRIFLNKIQVGSQAGSGNEGHQVERERKFGLEKENMSKTPTLHVTLKSSPPLSETWWQQHDVGLIYLAGMCNKTRMDEKISKAENRKTRTAVRGCKGAGIAVNGQ